MGWTLEVVVVANAHTAHQQLAANNVEVGAISVVDDRDGGTLAGFSDPDGNAWTVQQLRARAERPLQSR